MRMLLPGAVCVSFALSTPAMPSATRDTDDILIADFEGAGSLTAEGGSLMLESVKAYEMTSAWKEK